MQTATNVHTLHDTYCNLALRVLITGPADDFLTAVVPVLGPTAADARYCRIYIAQGPAASRDAITAAFHQTVGSQGLVIPCLVLPTVTIIVSLLNDTAGADIGPRLQDVIGNHPNWHLGGSNLTPLSEAHRARHDAEIALQSARHSTTRTAMHGGDVRIASVLDSRAGQWAKDVLRPLLELPDGKREPLMDTTRVALAFNHAAAARMLYTSRTRVTERLRRVQEMLGLDLSLVRDRAVLGLALEVHARPNGDGGSGWGSLVDMLTTPEVHAWAEDFLSQLAADGRPLRRTLSTWLMHNGHVAATAEALGLRPPAVRDHLKAAEALLSRHLHSVTSGTTAVNLTTVGNHGVFLALAITGDIPVARWPIPAGRRLPGVTKAAHPSHGA